jgi:hypothetical protein
MLVLTLVLSRNGVTVTCDCGTRIYVAGPRRTVAEIAVAHRDLARERGAALGPVAWARLERIAPYADVSAESAPR